MPYGEILPGDYWKVDQYKDHHPVFNLSVLAEIRVTMDSEAMKRMDSHIMDDTDLAGPLFFALMMGVFLLLTGKVHFGYIYGMGAVGCVSMYLILNLMCEQGIDIYRVISVLGYCLLPMVLLAFLSLIIPLKGVAGLIFAPLCILWCTHSSALMFVKVLSLVEQRLLVAYPIGLLYTCFALLTIF
eukprot:TRINITY_DN977_c0_g2_i2.p1 TRINITY_DN977_c0_g2~~TRINITY_DN977_c0_g2_i2.p1  ORF type:complete len:214 (+),score=21.73 TRINITY_DN977_c0_g2_i2:89-643(+)